MNNYEVRTFKYGVVTKVEQQSIPAGAASDSLNWITKGDKVELRRGYYLLGDDAGAGRVTGLNVGRLNDGTELLYKTYQSKLAYYDSSISDFSEIGTDILGTDANDEDIAFSNYSSLAGDQMWLASPRSSIFKIMLANPTSYADQYLSTKNYKGRINIKQNRTFLFRRTADKTGLYASYIDNAQYTTVASEAIGTGNGATKTFTNTLAFKGSGARRTCFGITVTDGTETFTDDYKGVLTGSLGGTGTINYCSGAISVTFNSAPANLQSITAGYQWEDSTNQGIADFSKSSPRTAGQGTTFRQDDGGGSQENIFSYNNVEYCMHQFKTWALTIGADDTTATNLIYRKKVGISNWRNAIETGSGIPYIDDSDINDQSIKLLTFDTNSAEVVPVIISRNIDLTPYLFDKGAVCEFGDLWLFACRTVGSSVNNRVLVYNKIWKSWDIVDYYVSCFTIYDGALVAGDSMTNNAYELFSGVDDDDSLIDNYWISGLSDLQISDMKKTRRLVVEGEIGADQEIKVYLSYDRGSFVEVGTIEGGGDYVDHSQSIAVGASTLGRPEVGGGSDGISAYHFKREFKLDTNKFGEVKIKFAATKIGWAAISMYRYQDIIRKNTKIALKYRV